MANIIKPIHYPFKILLHEKLKNGSTLTIYDTNQGKSMFSMFVNSGSFNECVENTKTGKVKLISGLAHLIEHLLFTNEKLENAIRNKNNSYNAITDDRITFYYFESLHFEIGEILKIFFDIIYNIEKQFTKEVINSQIQAITNENLKNLSDEVLKGSIISDGNCYLKIIRVGKNTVYGSIETEIMSKTIESPLKSRLRDLAKTISKIGYIGSFLVVVSYWFNQIVISNNFDINLIIENDLYEYPYQQYLDEEKKLDDMVEPIKKANLSPLEKYIAVYNIVKNFKPYKESEENREYSRYLRYILDNEYMVCVGYTKLLNVLLDKVGISTQHLSVYVDTSYKKGFTLEEKPVEYAGHARVIVNLDDDKYNIHGLYMSDPTWDNNLQNNYLNHAIMTFDKMQISNILFKYNNNSDIILDIHNFQEFNDQVNFLLKRKLDQDANFNRDKPFKEKILSAYKYVTNSIIDSFKFDEKTKTYYHELQNCQTENDYINLLTEIGHYLVTRINQPIQDETILQASLTCTQVLNNLDENTLNTLKKEQEISHKKREESYFPYILPEDNDFNLEDKNKSI